MKRARYIGLVVLFLLGLQGCQGTIGPTDGRSAQGELLLVTDEGALERPGMVVLGMELIRTLGNDGWTWRYSGALESTTAGRVEAITQGITLQTALVVCMRSAYEGAVYEAQKLHPDVMFLLLDGEPRHDEDGVYETARNTLAVVYEEQEAGFLAGYLLVQAGYRALGYCGGGEAGSAMAYGYGFLQGAEAAAVSLALEPKAITVQYGYVEGETSLAPTLEKWYAQGTEVIFVHEDGTEWTSQALAAAKESEGKVLGTDFAEGMNEVEFLGAVTKSLAQDIPSAVHRLTEAGGRWSTEDAGATLHRGILESGVQFSQSGEWPFSQMSQQSWEGCLQGLAQKGISMEKAANRELFPLTPHCVVTQHSMQ